MRTESSLTSLLQEGEPRGRGRKGGQGVLEERAQGEREGGQGVVEERAQHEDREQAHVSPSGGRAQGEREEGRAAGPGGESPGGEGGRAGEIGRACV